MGALGASTPENSIKKKVPTTMWSWVLRNKAAIAAGLTAATGAVWAVVVLMWPSLILPIFDPGRVDIAIKVDEVGRDAVMSSQEIQIELKNSSSTRVYLPATFMLVRAHRIQRKDSDAPKAKGLTLTPEQATTIRRALPELSNLVFKKDLEKQMARDDLSSDFDVRGRFFIDPEATTIQFSRFSGITHLLEPGASLKLSRVAFVPADHELMSVQVVSRATKRFSEDRAYFGFPAPSRPKILTFPRQPYLKDGKLDFEKFKKELGSIEEDVRPDQFDSTSTIEAYVGAKPPKAKEGGS
jgi:hypothetical protein